MNTIKLHYPKDDIWVDISSDGIRLVNDSSIVSRQSEYQSCDRDDIEPLVDSILSRLIDKSDYMRIDKNTVAFDLSDCRVIVGDDQLVFSDIKSLIPVDKFIDPSDFKNGLLPWLKYSKYGLRDFMDPFGNVNNTIALNY